MTINDSTYIDVTYEHNLVSVDEKESFNMSFSPNPTKGEVRFTFNNSDLHYIEIIDILGKAVTRRTLVSGQVINLSNENKGVYFVRISDSNGKNVVARKLILE